MTEFIICAASAVAVGIVIAIVAMITNRYSQGFLITLALLPVVVQTVIMLVNGSIGTGIAIAGAFSLVRFRSVPGTAKEISLVFLAMAAGLAMGTNCIAIGWILVAVTCLILLILEKAKFGIPKSDEKTLKITIPENLEYTDLFEDIFENFTSKSELTQVKTTNMGSMYTLAYRIIIKDTTKEKEMIDAIRCRNGNLDIVCGKVSAEREEL